MNNKEKFREFQKLMSETYKETKDTNWAVIVGGTPNKLEDKNLVVWLQKRAKELGDKYIS